MPGSEVRAHDISVDSQTEDLLDKVRRREGMESNARLDC